MTSSRVEGEDEFRGGRRGVPPKEAVSAAGWTGFSPLGLVFWLDITVCDDLIHNAHYSPLEMSIFSPVPNNCGHDVNTVNDCRLVCVGYFLPAGIRAHSGG